MNKNRIHFPLAATFAVALFIGVTTTANGQATNTTPLIPEIHLKDVPITTTIDAFAREAGINYLIDPKLFQLFQKQEPSVTVTWTNISIKDALARLLKEHGLVMVEDKFTTIARIASTNSVLNVVDASLLGSDTNNAASLTNGLIPMIRFQDVPLDVALQSLIDHDKINVVVDPKVSEHDDLHDYGIISFTVAHPTMISIRWENVTARQAVVALCENYDLTIVKDSATGVVSIKPKN